MPRPLSRRGSAVRCAAALTAAAVAGALGAPVAAAASQAESPAAATSAAERVRHAAADAAERELPARGPVRLVAVVDERGRPDVEVAEAADAAHARELLEDLRADDDVVTVEIDRPVRLALTATDPLRPRQWAMDRLAADDLADLSDGRGVVVAVVDTGVDSTHRDLAGVLVHGLDVVDGTSTHDTNGHGTHVAGVIAAVAGNGLGIAGLVPGTRVMPVRALDAEGSGWASDVAEGITGAVDAGADVVNLSFGSTEPSAAVSAAVQYAVSRGVPVIAAGGNDRRAGSPAFYPAAEPATIAVAATTSADVSATFSTRGDYLTLAAPGAGILSTVPGGYAEMSGSSMAAPHVAATVAAMLAVRPSLTPAQVRDLLVATADDLETTGFDTATGYGLVDPVGTVRQLLAEPAPAQQQVTEPAPAAAPAPEPAPAPAPPPERAWAARDWTGDRLPDVLAGSGSDLYLYRGLADGRIAGRGAHIGSGWSGMDLLTLTPDWSGDGVPDVIARSTRDGRLWLYRGTGTGGFGRATAIGTRWDAFTAFVAPGDWDGDGAADLLARTRAGDLWLYRGDGSGGFGRATRVGTGWNAFTALVSPGDWDGDGTADVLARDGLGRLWLYPGTGTGGFDRSRLVGTGWNGLQQITAAGDRTGDGVVDVLGVAATGDLWTYPGNGSGGFARPVRTGSGWTGLTLIR